MPKDPVRRAVRALIVAPGPQVLLVRFRFGPLQFWAPPGGGVEAGEDEATALRRELLEEVGLQDVELGPVVYTHERSYIGRSGAQRDVVVRVDVPEAFVPSPTLSAEALLAEHVEELRWFDLDELRSQCTLPYDLGRFVSEGPSGPVHLDDLRVPPVVVMVSGPAGSGRSRLAQAIGTARQLPVFPDDEPEELRRMLASGRSLVMIAPCARTMTRLRGQLRFQVVRLQLHTVEGPVDPIDTDGLLLHLDAPQEVDVDAALGVVDQVLPPGSCGVR